jgi:serine protease inhibitor
MSLGGSNTEQFDMKVDRPFAFILGNSRTGTFLFAGAVQDPKDSKMPVAEAEQERLKRTRR